MDSTITPKSHREAVAIFRSEVIGALVRRELDHGELIAELRRLSPAPWAYVTLHVDFA